MSGLFEADCRLWNISYCLLSVADSYCGLRVDDCLLAWRLAMRVGLCFPLLLCFSAATSACSDIPCFGWVDFSAHDEFRTFAGCQGSSTIDFAPPSFSGKESSSGVDQSFMKLGHLGSDQVGQYLYVLDIDFVRCLA